LVANLDVEKNFIPAIEAALGRNLQAIVLKNAQLAPEIIAALKEKKLGQAALVIPQLGNGTTKERVKLAPEKSLGWAIDKVKAPDSLAPLLARFLHKVAIFPDLDEALRFKNNGNNLAAATLAGEFISADGVVFAGRGEAPSASLLERKGQISILTAEHSVLSAQREALRQKRDEAKTRFEKATHDFAEARTQSETADRAQSSAENRILFLERELNDLSRVMGDPELYRDAARARQTVKRYEELAAALESLRARLSDGQEGSDA